MFSSYELKVSPRNRYPANSWLRSRSGGEIFSRIWIPFSDWVSNLFLRSIYIYIYIYILRNFYIHCISKLRLVLFTKNLKNFLLHLCFGKEDTMKPYFFLWISSRCRAPTNRKWEYQALIYSNTTELGHFSWNLCHPFWIMVFCKIFPT